MGSRPGTFRVAAVCGMLSTFVMSSLTLIVPQIVVLLCWPALPMERNPIPGWDWRFPAGSCAARSTAIASSD